MSGSGTHQIAILGAIGKGFKSIDELDRHLPISRKEISKAACKLIVKKLIDRLEIGCYQLTDEGRNFLAEGRTITSGPNKPLSFLRAAPENTFRQRAWNAMRLQHRFTVPSISMVAKTASDGNVVHNLQVFIRRLVAAGYVVELPAREKGTAVTSNGFKVFRLIKDTGHFAPVWSKGKMVDRNLAEGCNDNLSPA